MFRNPASVAFSDSHYYKIATFDTNCLAKANQVPLWWTEYLGFSLSCSPCTTGFSSSCTCILPVSYLRKCGLRQWWTGILNLEPHRTLEISRSYCFFSHKKNYLSKTLTLNFSSFSLIICYHHHTPLSLQSPCCSTHLPLFFSAHISGCHHIKLCISHHSPSEEALQQHGVDTSGSGLSSSSGFWPLSACRQRKLGLNSVELRWITHLKFLILMPVQLFSDSH